MEVNPEVFDAIVCPAAIDGVTAISDCQPEAPGWDASNLNPKNRINTLTDSQRPQWRFYGAAVDGTQFYAVPDFAIGKPPRRIDLYIPEWKHIAPHLREILQCRETMFIHGPQVANLNISKHLQRALEVWTSRWPGFEQAYMSQPFGSSIVVENISTSVQDMAIHLIAHFGVEQQWLSLKSLHSLWPHIPLHDWPSTIPLDHLELHSQLHETITLVTLQGQATERKFIFKSLLHNVKYMYHELNQLLTVPPHPNVISRPLFLVTQPCRFGGKVGVCGFVLEYLPLGTLRNELLRQHRPSEPPQHQPPYYALRWARQITSALIHAQRSPSGYYSDLKLDNIVLATSEDGSPKGVLIDFEQRGGWASWSPPEVTHIDALDYLASFHPSAERRAHFASQLRALDSTWQPRTATGRYQGSVVGGCSRRGAGCKTTCDGRRCGCGSGRGSKGYAVAWTSLTAAERERATVFMMGKLLWCLCEGVGAVSERVECWSFQEPVESPTWPAFRKTPPKLQSLIRRCTVGAPEWEGRWPAVVRQGSRIVVKNNLGRGEGRAEDVIRAAKGEWCAQVDEAERFLEARIQARHEHGDVQECRVMALAGTRPSLQEIYVLLEEVS